MDFLPKDHKKINATRRANFLWRVHTHMYNGYSQMHLIHNVGPTTIFVRRVALLPQVLLLVDTPKSTLFDACHNELVLWHQTQDATRYVIGVLVSIRIMKALKNYLSIATVGGKGNGFMSQQFEGEKNSATRRAKLLGSPSVYICKRVVCGCAITSRSGVNAQQQA